MSAPSTAGAVTEDRLLDGRVRLRQPAQGYRAAIDPVFLAAAIPAAGRLAVLDLGCGVGAAALCLLARAPEVEVTGLEIQAELAGLARENARLNGWDDRFRVVDGDLTDLSLAADGTLPEAGYDEVLCNPPHHPADATAAPNPAKATANRESDTALTDWAAAALRLCRPKGAITFIHRADRLGELLAALRGQAGAAVVFPLWPKAGRPARRVLVRARKGRKAPLALAPGLVLHEADGRFTAAANAILREGGALTL